jgi:hypothetical protein
MGQHAQPIQRHRGAIDPCQPRTPDRRQAQHGQRHGVVGRIAGEVDGIGQQRCGLRLEAADHFDQDDGGIDGQRYPQDTPPLRVGGMSAVGGAMVVVAVSRHGFPFFGFAPLCRERPALKTPVPAESSESLRLSGRG